MRRSDRVVWLLLLASPALWGQTLGEIAGEVVDASGSAVPAAKVTVTNVATNVSRSSTTNEAGIYSFPALVPGTYSVRVEAGGFRPTVRTGIELQVQQTARVDFRLEVGQVSETVEVVASSSLLTSESATVGTVIENRRIVELPLNGRNFLQLVSLSPNVSYGFASPGQAAGRQGGTRSNQNISISGMRGTWNHYTLDGIENTDVNFNLYVLLPSVDALQEFKVQSGIYPAEFGRGAAQVNVSTKPGTNEYHGALYEFMRNSALDARPYDFIGTSPEKAPFRWNQYGFTLGGPVRIPKLFNGRDRLFFMSNFEGYKERRTVQGTYTTPTVAMRRGDFSGFSQLFDPATRKVEGGTLTATPFPNNQIPSSRFDPISVKLLEFWPEPNINTPVLRDNFQQTQANRIDKDQFTQRIDFNESSASQWFGRYSWTDESTVTPGLKLSGTVLYTRASQYMVSNTRVLSPTKVNEFRFGLNKFYNVIGQELGGKRNVVEELGLPIKMPDPTTWGIPTIRGLTGGLSEFGNSPNGPFTVDNRIYQFIDNLSWIRGKHSIRFGGEYRYDKFFQAGNEFARGVFEFNGQYTANPTTMTGGNSAADFLLGTTSRAEISIALAQADFRASNVALYIDDAYRVTPRLTVNLGLRWEFFQPYYDKLENQVNLWIPVHATAANVADPALHPVLVRTGSGDFYEGKDFRYPGIATARDGRLGKRLIKNDLNNFAPRFGIAFSPNDRWSIRTGFGIFYSAESGNSRFDLNRGMGGRVSRQANPQIPDITYQNFLSSAALPWVLPPAPFLWGVKPDVGTSYSMMYLFNIQRQFGANTALEIGYNGAQHRRLQGLQNMNAPVLGTTSYASRAPFPEYGVLQVVHGEGTGNYNGFSVKLTQRMSNGLTALVSYTWSKALDSTSAIRGNANDIFPQDSRCLKCDMGFSAYNTPHRFVASTIYELPFGRGKLLANRGGIVNQVIGGWQVGSIFTIQSGRPINTQTYDAGRQGTFGETRLNATGIDPYMPEDQRGPNSWFNPAAFSNPAPGTLGNISRNRLQGPGTFAWDFSALKNFPITENHYLQFRFEAFNFPNHPGFGNPNANWNSSTSTPAPTFGLIRSTAFNMRELQFALKYVF